MPAAFDDIFLFEIVVVVIDERRELHQAFDEILVQFHKKTEVRPILEETAELFTDLVHHELSFL